MPVVSASIGPRPGVDAFEVRVVDRPIGRRFAEILVWSAGDML
jgi:hypothetical protein